MKENKEKDEFLYLLNELSILASNILKGKPIAERKHLWKSMIKIMEERKENQEIQIRLKKLGKDKKLSDPVDFYDFSNLKKRK